jgi:hypothetical protein
MRTPVRTELARGAHVASWPDWLRRRRCDDRAFDTALEHVFDVFEPQIAGGDSTLKSGDETRGRLWTRPMLREKGKFI